jgi:N-acetylmuramoyl-L-alanine amidase
MNTRQKIISASILALSGVLGAQVVSAQTQTPQPLQAVSVPVSASNISLESLVFSPAPVPVSAPFYKASDLSQDSDRVLLARMIFGEARGQSYDEKVAIGYTVINRANDDSLGNGHDVRSVVLKNRPNKNGRSIYQYSCFDPLDANNIKLKDPLSHDSSNVWNDCLIAADEVLSNKRPELNKGQDHYHEKKMRTPYWAPSMNRLDMPSEFKHFFYESK